jgi:hypothetical protein
MDIDHGFKQCDLQNSALERATLQKRRVYAFAQSYRVELRERARIALLTHLAWMMYSTGRQVGGCKRLGPVAWQHGGSQSAIAVYGGALSHFVSSLLLSSHLIPSRVASSKVGFVLFRGRGTTVHALCPSSGNKTSFTSTPFDSKTLQ